MEKEAKLNIFIKLRRVFLLTFIISIVILFIPKILVDEVNIKGVPQMQYDSKPHIESRKIELDSSFVISLVSLLTSITSLIGFLSTTILAWRKEKRELISSELERKKIELEVEKLKSEIQERE